MPPRLDTALRAETPEGIALDLRVAGLHARGVAWLLDFLLRAAMLYAVAIVAGYLGALRASVYLIAAFLLEWFYPVLFELSPLGATPGKRAVDLRVVMDDGLPLTPAASLTRNLMRAADFLPFAYAAAVFSMLWRSDFKRLGDIVAGTLVIHVPRELPPVQLAGIAPLAPSGPIPLDVQSALVNLALRAPRLTPQRVDEIAALVAPLCVPAGLAVVPLTERVLGVAQWLMGRRTR